MRNTAFDKHISEAKEVKKMTDLKSLCQEVLDLFRKIENLEKDREKQDEYIRQLETENRKLKYEYPDSKRKRDKPLPYKWRYDGIITYQFCPKCGMMISNWQGYCHACGQKIMQGSPLPENEIKNEVE